MWSVSQVSSGRRLGRLDRKRPPELQHSDRESEIHFRLPLMFGPRGPGTIALDEPAGVLTCHVIVLNRRVGLCNFENTSRWQILQWLASE